MSHWISGCASHRADLFVQRGQTGTTYRKGVLLGTSQTARVVRTTYVTSHLAWPLPTPLFSDHSTRLVRTVGPFGGLPVRKYQRTGTGPSHSRGTSTIPLSPTVLLTLPPPPFVIPPPGGNAHLAQKVLKILGAKGAKEKFYKALNAPKLIYTVILCCTLVVLPPRGRTITTLVGRLQGGG